MAINQQLLDAAHESLRRKNILTKQGFVAGGDPTMTGEMPAAPTDATGGLAGMAPGMGASPGMAPGMGIPAGAPQQVTDPAAASQELAPELNLQEMVNNAVATAMQSQQQTGSKPKAKSGDDVNVRLSRIEMMLAKMMDAAGIPQPVSELLGAGTETQEAQPQQDQTKTAAPYVGGFTDIGTGGYIEPERSQDRHSNGSAADSRVARVEALRHLRRAM